MDDIQFLTQNCKMGVTGQRRYLEGKYSSHTFFSKNLYAAIRKFCLTAKSLSSDAALMLDWLDKQKEQDPKWIVIRGWDDNNALTHLIWMTPKQVENWIQFSDCIINDVTHKTNRYGMALSLFVGFDRNMQNIIFAQDADPAVDAAVKKVFTNTYPVYCAFHHITQNLHKNLRKRIGEHYDKFLQDFYLCRNSLVQSTFHDRFMKLIENYSQSKSYLEVLYTSKEYWAHSYTNFRFTEGMIASSHVESVNAYIKRMLFNSNVSLCELMSEIHKLINEQDKKNKYEYWKLAIPSIKNLEHANFLFTEVDKCCQNFLTPAILKLEESCEDECAESPQATIDQLIEVSGHDNVKEIWVVRVGNSQTAKYHIVLLKNDAHICFCLMIIQKGIVCRHFFQIMLNTCEARFHIRLISSRWYQEGKDALREPFIIADKFYEGNTANKAAPSQFFV
ncbi:protein FAR1-RELATED SEQUENCE 5-like [Rhizophagus irregularis DAOM 181602=DAOM 197198]|nr:protein FAR1-RELATED SEQUENCE 5-like [Rhizophagus irregularis DAOM 181602=DAOM 197198]